MSRFQEHTFATPSSLVCCSFRADWWWPVFLIESTAVKIFDETLINLLVFPTDKNFDDEDSVDGGRSSSSSSSKGFSSSRRGGSMGSMRRPSSASGSRAAGKTTLQLSPGYSWATEVRSLIRINTVDIHKYFA